MKIKFWKIYETISASSSTLCNECPSIRFNDDGTIKDDAPQHYKDLFNGSEYLDKRGHIVLYEGMAPTLVYFTFARFIEADAVHYTPTGPVVKHHDNGDAVAPKDIIKLVQQQRSVANAHANEIEKFLRDHRDDFPLWQYNGKNKTARQSGPRIRSIDRTNFNLSDYTDCKMITPIWN